MIEKLRYRGESNTHFQKGDDYVIEFYITQQKCTVKLPGQVEKAYPSFAKFTRDWQIPVAKVASEPLVVDPYDIFAQAEGFREASMLEEASGRALTGNAMLNTVAVVTHVFAIELYLKCMLVIDNNNVPREHSLKKLYELLNPNTQDALQKKYEELLPKYINGINASNSSINLASEEFTPLKTDFTSAISGAEHHFQKFRYLFEFQSDTGLRSNGVVWCLLASVRSHIMTIKPDWHTGYPVLLRKMALSLPDNTKDLVKQFRKTQLNRHDNQYILGTRCHNGKCPHYFKMAFNMEPGVPIPKWSDSGRNKVWLYPSDGVIRCPRCNANTHYGLLKNAIEEYTGRKVYLP